MKNPTEKGTSCLPSNPFTHFDRKHIALHFLTSGWLSEETEGSRSTMASTAPGWMTTMSVEDDEEMGWEEFVKWSFRSVSAFTGAGGPDVP